MNPTPQQLARARAAADQLKERGPGNGRGPVSFTRDPSLYIEAIARAVLEDVPEPKTTRKRKA
jgi:hypothetical protein